MKNEQFDKAMLLSNQMRRHDELIKRQEQERLDLTAKQIKERSDELKAIEREWAELGDDVSWVRNTGL